MCVQSYGFLHNYTDFIKTCNLIFNRFEAKLQLFKKQQLRLKLYEKITDPQLREQLIKLR